jgi:hypothetical protein
MRRIRHNDTQISLSNINSEPVALQFDVFRHNRIHIKEAVPDLSHDVVCIVNPLKLVLGANPELEPSHNYLPFCHNYRRTAERTQSAAPLACYQAHISNTSSRLFLSAQDPDGPDFSPTQRPGGFVLTFTRFR